MHIYRNFMGRGGLIQRPPLSYGYVYHTYNRLRKFIRNYGVQAPAILFQVYTLNILFYHN